MPPSPADDFETLRGLFADAPVGAALVAPDRRVSWANTAFCRLVGRSSDQVVGQDVRSFGEPEEAFWHQATAVHRQSAPHAATVRRYERPTGEAVWARLTLVAAGDGRAFAFVDDVTEAHLASRRLHSLVENAPVAILTVGKDGRISQANPETERLLGYARGALLGRPVEDLVPARHRAQHPHQRSIYNAAPTVRRIGHGRDVHAVRSDGSEVEVEASLNPVGDGATQVVLIDVTGRKDAERALKARAARQQAIATFGEQALSGAAVRELEQLACELVRAHLGVEVSKVLEADVSGRLIVRAGAGLDDKVPVGATLPMEGTHAGMALRSNEPVVIADVAHAPGVQKWSLLRRLGIRSSAAVLIGTLEDPLGVLGAHTRRAREFSGEDRDFLKVLANVLADAIRRQRAEAAIRHQALHDPLTGLPNRTLLLERVRHRLGGGERDDAQCALIIVDIDHLKMVNDSLGHHVGDDLLRAIGPRLRRAVRPRDTVARFAAGSFAIFCEDLSGEADAMAVADRVNDSLTEPFVLVGGHRQPVTASLGVALSGRPAADPDELVRNADLAMYRAKQSGRGTTVMFAPAMHERSVRRRNEELDLRSAIEAGDIDLHFQPIVSMESRRPVGFEALARWTHPQRGPIPPLEFIAVAEDAGMIGDLCAAVLRRAAWQAMMWSDDVYVAVNLSPREIGERATVDRVRDVLAETRLPAQRLALEVTETAILNDITAASKVLDDLRGIGVRIKLDDFGTGFSSLTHAQSLPVDCLKIDRSFIRNLDAQRPGRAVVSAIMELASGLDADVVAEGVETAGEHEALLRLGCRQAQGYLYARPMPAAGVAGYLDAGAQRPG